MLWYTIPKAMAYSTMCEMEYQIVLKRYDNWLRIIPNSLVKSSFATCSLLFILIVSIAACTQSKEEILSDAPDAASLSFVSHSDMKDWIADAPNLHWGIAMSSRDIASVKEKNGKGYNQPAISAEEYDRYVIADDLQTGEQISLTINPGTYDWLIIIDEDNDGTWDSYLGSIEQDIQLNGMQFLANERYEVVVGADSIPRLFRDRGE